MMIVTDAWPDSRNVFEAPLCRLSDRLGRDALTIRSVEKSI
jgi:hypothetical protein